MIEAPAAPFRTRVRRFALALTRGLVALLVVHHGWLLFQRLRNDSISEPTVALRWGLAALVLGLALLFRRRGLTVLSGRSGLVFWLLVLLLHVGVTPIPDVTARSEHLLVALPLGVAAALIVTLGAILLSGRIGARNRVRPLRATSGPPPPRPAAARLALRFAPRPPPAV